MCRGAGTGREEGQLRCRRNMADMKTEKEGGYTGGQHRDGEEGRKE